MNRANPVIEVFAVDIVHNSNLAIFDGRCETESPSASPRSIHRTGDLRINTAEADGTLHLVSLINSGEVYPCHPDESLLAGMLRTGRKGIPLGCRGGGCGVCLVEIKSGEFTTGAMSSNHVNAEARSKNQLLACRVFPRSDLEIQVLGTMQRSIWREAVTQKS